MKNITVAVSDDVYRTVRIRAAEQGTSVSALVGAYLTTLAGQAGEFDALERRQLEIQAEIGHFSAGARLSRDAVHERAVR